MKRIFLNLLLLAAIFPVFNTSAQINYQYLYIRPETYTSLSVYRDSGITLIGKKETVVYKRNDTTNHLKGSLGHINGPAARIYTIEQPDEKAKKSTCYLYDLKGNKQDSIPLAGNVTSITTSANGKRIYMVFHNNNSDRDLVKVCKLPDKDVHPLFEKGSRILTSICRLKNGNLGLGGSGNNFIINQEGELVQKISAPHVSYVRTNIARKNLCILQGYNDGSYLDIYTCQGEKQNTIKYQHPEKPDSGTRSCAFCKTKTAAFEDFDVSPDSKHIIAKDHYNKVYLLNKNSERIRTFENSGSWSFLTFITNTKFMYLDKTTETVKTRRIKDK